MTDPNGRDVTERMVRRMDALEGQFTRLERERLRALQGDIAGVKRSIERLLYSKAAAGGQPDWLACRETDAAQDILLAASDWTHRYGEPLGVDLPGCWPWHPGAVALLLATMNHHAAAMSGDAESAVTDLLLRVVPLLSVRIRALAHTQGCNDAQHKVGGGWFAYDPDRLVELALWWATDRLGLAPGLTPWEERIQ